MTRAELLAIAKEVCTAKQYDILRHALNGISERVIARGLHISRSTVRTHLAEAKRKVNRELRKRGEETLA